MKSTMFRCAAALFLVGAMTAQAAPPAATAAMNAIGRAATPAELKAWDIDVRGDFQGLPKGSGSVAMGNDVWDAKCTSCHGAFGESNAVFTPIVGGTSKKDIETGRVYFLSHPGYPHRTTLMKVSHLSSLWDYIHRAMPWNAPKSLSTDEVYGVLAYILSLGEIVPADFTLSDKNIAEVEKRLPNRDGHFFMKEMWEVRGKGDVVNPLCMSNCPVAGSIESSLPESARNSNGNIADQVRGFGEARGTDTAPSSKIAAVGSKVAPSSPASASNAETAKAISLVKSNGCIGCHGIANKIVGPGFQEVARKYSGRADEVTYLAVKIRKGGQGVWGPIPMPEQAQLSDADLKAIAEWLAAGAHE